MPNPDNRINCGSSMLRSSPSLIHIQQPVNANYPLSFPCSRAPQHQVLLWCHSCLSRYYLCFLATLFPKQGRVSIPLPQDHFCLRLTCFSLSLACMIFFFSHLQRAVTIAVCPRTRSSFCHRQRKKTPWTSRPKSHSGGGRWWKLWKPGLSSRLLPI